MSPRTILHLSQQLFAGGSNRLSPVGVVGLGDQVIASVVQLDDHVLLRRSAPVGDAHVRGHLFFEVLEVPVDLFQVALDLVDV